MSEEGPSLSETAVSSDVDKEVLSPDTKVKIIQFPTDKIPGNVSSIDQHPRYRWHGKEEPYRPPSTDEPDRRQKFIQTHLVDRVKGFLSGAKNLSVDVYDQAELAIRYQVEQEFNLRNNLGLLSKTRDYLRFLTQTADKNPQLIGLGVATGLSLLTIVGNINLPINPFYGQPSISPELAARLSASIGASTLGYEKGGKFGKRGRIIGAALTAAGGFGAAEGTNRLVGALPHLHPALAVVDPTAAESTLAYVDDVLTAGVNTAVGIKSGRKTGK